MARKPLQTWLSGNKGRVFRTLVALVLVSYLLFVSANFLTDREPSRVLPPQVEESPGNIQSAEENIFVFEDPTKETVSQRSEQPARIPAYESAPEPASLALHGDPGKDGTVADIETLNLTETWSHDALAKANRNPTKEENESIKWSESNKLRVFLVPHSHNDAGWLQTFEQYYESSTKKILNNLLEYLPQNPDMRFVWAEIAFFDLWWKDLNEEKRQGVRRLVDNGQLEFIGGGWVMSDEASAHYVSHLTQMIEGHQWLYQRLNTTPTRAWSIDPFGLSSSYAYLNKAIGFQGSVITRAHYGVKKLLGREKNFEFFWRQTWDPEGDSDLLTHMMPSMTYDTADTCGPDHNVCVKFNGEIMGERAFNLSSQSAIQESSLSVLGQFRKKAQLFATNNILVAVGGDFKWSKRHEWTEGVKYLKAVAGYINSKTDLFTDVKITTLNDYFKALEDEVAASTFSPKTLTGDFFTYADRPNEYWSGYFTSRIFHKTTERHLLGFLRGAEILFTLASAEIQKKMGTLSYDFIDSMYGNISVSRQALSLFQHHDGITGTSKDPVVTDYAIKMHDAITRCHQVMQQSLAVLTNLDRVNEAELSRAGKEESSLESVTYRRHPKDVGLNHLLEVPQDSQTLLTVFNPLPERKLKLVRVNVTMPDVKVLDLEGNEIHSEVYPTFHYVPGLKNKTSSAPSKLEVVGDQFELLFPAEFKPLEIRSFVLTGSPRSENSVTIKILNTEATKDAKLSSIFSFPTEDNSNFSEVIISNEKMNLRFNVNGELIGVRRDDEDIPLNLTYHHYSSYSSGVYLFGPREKASSLQIEKPVVVVVQGKSESYVQAYYETVHQRIGLVAGLGADSNAINVDLRLDVGKQHNYELIMRLGTNLNTNDTFYTDSNGFQMLKRKYISDIPIAANYYPLASSAYIEDPNLRVTLVAGQPGGASSLESGQLEIMLDRILNQDDSRGVGQGGTDNVLTLSTFKILLERPNGVQESEKPPAPALSLAAHHHLLDLLHPLILFYKRSSQELDVVKDYSVTSSKQLPCGILLAAVMSLEKQCGVGGSNCLLGKYQTGSLIHRVGYDSRFEYTQLKDQCDLEGLETFSVSDVFGELMSPVVERTTLNFVYRKEALSSKSSVAIKPMEMYAFKTQFQNQRTA